jgi:hypothetical protein
MARKVAHLPVATKVWVKTLSLVARKARAKKVAHLPLATNALYSTKPPRQQSRRDNALSDKKMSLQLSSAEGKKINSAVDSYALSLSLGKKRKYKLYSWLVQKMDDVFSAWLLGNNCSAETFGIHCMSMWMHRSARTLLGILPQASWLHNLSKLGNNSSHIETVLVLLCPLVDFVDVY